jgi:hypothetical protein
MSKYRRAARIDTNQPQIVKELRARGLSVELDHDDILVGHNGITYWYEIKTSEKAVVKESQKKILAEYKGHYKIVWSTEMILEDMGIIK